MVQIVWIKYWTFDLFELNGTVALKLIITISILFLSLLGNAQPSYSRIHKFGWEPWKTILTYYDSTNVVKDIHKHKLKSKCLGSTTWITKHKLTKFDENGNWYLKTKYKTNAGCFHFKTRVIWKRERKEYAPAEE